MPQYVVVALLLIGVSLLASGLHHEIPRGYIYFAMGFSVFVEILNLRMRDRAAVPVELHRQYLNHNSRAAGGGSA